MRVVDDLIKSAIVSAVTVPQHGSPAVAAAPVVLNMGGPNRVHRLAMARAVFHHFGYNHALLQGGEQTSPITPLDISMDISLLKENRIGGNNDETLAEMVQYTFEST